MPQNVAQVIAGFGTLYIAPFSAAIPTLTGAPASDFPSPTWDTPGYTDDGIEFDYSATDKEIHVDEESFPVDVLIDKEVGSANVKLAQTSMQNLYYAMTGANFNGTDTITFGGNSRPNFFRLGFSGPGPGTTGIREICLFKVYPKSAVKVHYKRNDKIVYQVQFMVLADSTQAAGSRGGTFKDF